MKTEARHELATNTLAKTLHEWGEKLRPYSSAILTGAAVVLGLYAVLSMWNARTAGREQEAWTAFERALMQGDVGYTMVEQVAASDEFSGSPVREWAYMAWADRQLRMASEMYLYDREGAKERLTSIAAIYDQFANQAGDAELQNRARLGQARVSEMRDRLDEARGYYAEVQGPLSVVAAARLKELEGKSVAETAAWLASAELPRLKPPTGPGTPGARPGLGADVPPAEGAAEPFDPAKTMEEILGGRFDDDAADGTRYSEGGTAGDAAASEEAATPEGAAAPEDAAAPKTETAAPAADGAAAETAPSETPAQDEPPAQQ